ncbi:MAG: thioredoxin family protein [Candidatus Cloacimonetes bacterium]|jgi:small redox-active disulfide protein 2|nr:thioredoxin family protein [Candidatus Cloacimonadota bacterium]MDY0299866.1 thioredoxin family protein [Candidatus Cloacimonadaceae bacterium]MCB5279752.1 thioredoxin family protein [Candidatus Cloacimonadota bacterium]MCK9333225.1 thioredoxin family protein [Candidatus Cloacimonadota bacterium]MDD2210262.1 thioredoxin family protein [Candidatus Cloacimonadota bacterium]
MQIKILGTGCPKCRKLEENARQAVSAASIEASIEKVEDLNRIMDYGVMLTPALVIDENVVSSGKVISSDEIKALIDKLV